MHCNSLIIAMFDLNCLNCLVFVCFLRLGIGIRLLLCASKGTWITK